MRVYSQFLFLAFAGTSIRAFVLKLTYVDYSTDHARIICVMSCAFFNRAIFHPASSALKVSPGKVGAALGLDTGPATPMSRNLGTMG